MCLSVCARIHVRKMTPYLKATARTKAVPLTRPQGALWSPPEKDEAEVETVLFNMYNSRGTAKGNSGVSESPSHSPAASLDGSPEGESLSWLF